MVAAGWLFWNQFRSQAHIGNDETRTFAYITMIGVPVYRVYLDEEQTFRLVDEDEASIVLKALLLEVMPEELAEEFMKEVVQDEALAFLSVFLSPEYVELLEGVYFEVRDGGLAFIKSSCPDQVCVEMGFQQRVGGFAACLPNQLHFFVEVND